MRLWMINRWIFFCLFSLVMPFFFVEASLVNPDLRPRLPGYKDFNKGRAYFNEENWEEAIFFFDQAIKKSKKPLFNCDNFYADEEGASPETSSCGCEGDPRWIYYNRYIQDEIEFAVYRHSHFYFGLIRLYQGDINKANLHFKRAIGFKNENEMGELFYSIANFMDPYWIVLSSLTNLQIGHIEEAEKLCGLGFQTQYYVNDIEYECRDDKWILTDCLSEEHVDDFIERFANREWEVSRLILLCTTDSIINDAINKIDIAIERVEWAICEKDGSVRWHILPEQLPAYSVLYSNCGVLYTKKGEYHKALLNFTKAIEFNSLDPELYFCRGNVYLIREEYSKALADYQQAILLDPSNSKYYRQRALAYTIMGSLDKAKQDLAVVEEQNNKLKAYQNELGLQEFSKGSFEKAIDHFNQFIEFHPHLATGYQNRGAALYQAGKLEEAIRDYSEAIRLDPAQADLYQMRAVAFMSLPATNEKEKRAHLMEAQNNLLTALEINPKGAEIYQNLAASCSLGGNLRTALDFYQKALELAPKQDHPQILKNLSSLHFKLGEYEKALLNCEKAIQLGCKEGELYFIQGCSLFETNQTEQALQKYDLAIHAGYDDPKVYFHRAKAYFCLHQFDKALEDATRVLKADADNTECYKLRGLISLSKHQDLEAYADFRMALRTSTSALDSDSPINNNANQANNSFLKLNAAGTMFQSGDLVTSLDGLSIYMPFLESQLTFSEKSLLKKMGQIQFDVFGRGLAAGLIDGGAETLKELGPFLANILFHPIETTEELLTAIQFLFSKALEEEWETVFEALAPELKELLSKWDQIEDYHKGRLTGLFIGKNGVAALTALGAVKTCSKLKNVVVGGYKTKFSCLLKRTKPEVLALPASELSLPPVPKDKGWHLSYPGGEVIKTEFYHEHALFRISPELVQQRSILEERAIRKSHELGVPFNSWEEFENLTLTELTEAGQPLALDSRGIQSSIVEAEIANTGSTGRKVEVILNEQENIVTVGLAAKTNKILVRNKNTKNHIMQSEHAWDKLIKLTGDVEEDCKNVIKLLEENQIFLEKYRVKPIESFGKFIRYNHQMKINGYQVKAAFNVNLENGEMFLNDAWVITK